jgi:bilirubin oxidase
MQVTTNPAPGATEDWEFINLTPDAHPIHIHERYFQVRPGVLTSF